MEELKPINEIISLKNKRALITGAAAGIGAAIAYRFAEAGAILELVDIDMRGLNALKRKLSKFNIEVNVYKVDLSKRENIISLWNDLEQPPDILVNNAGIYLFKEFTEVDEDFLDKIFDVNVKSVFWMCQEMIKRRKRGGVIINVASIEAVLPFATGLVHYDISKMGVIALTRALAREYGKIGFRVNALIPGGIETKGVKKLKKEAAMKLNMDMIKTAMNFKNRLPLGRFGSPDEVARMALVLASDMSSYMTGAMVAVDGGFLSA
ncbi:SDR family NAD(P)-dependent oxidoreductase [Candidatus Aciduliprofundum boonei]|uniref:Short-chain dehydrogenase/reductase SDR n=1 Tax=Aciduliprofundum boonei (strain DSM 19572 / T469) TaxID=439481 RepID=B5IAG6_ACIB4|nr:SDR family oxidoreductase [Candidatus Aciduliprofundum boonei]ADD08677.1 short-chain dehydrogenase/reductase SDR [Aciduliprofundum boonei T469]EDY36946.1 oxidoreductase, short chain dehydrogenase/reductase family [Aciduliprofundum boonei T469]HII54860.1 SDR family oxidoreductase [Candidatus Aciduliprofundum boonei]